LALVCVMLLTAACSDPDKERIKRTTLATYDRNTGKLIQLTHDRNKNGVIDTWTDMDGTKPLRFRIDLDEDGKIDRWEYYDDNGALLKVGFSRLPVTLGQLCSGVALGRRGLKPGFRWTLLWLSSPDANRLLLLVGASAVMALSLILTMSRSGMAAAALAAIVTAGLSLKRHATRARKITGVAIVCAVTLMVVGWTGADTIARRFSDANWGEINNRKGPWMDAIGIVARYPLVGTGLNTYGVATLFYQRHDLSQHYAQAHNDYLQLAAEGGALLVIPAAASAVIFITVVRRRFQQEISTTGYWIRAGAVTGLLAIALQEVVEFSLQMPGNALLFVVLCAIALHRTPNRRLLYRIHHER